MRNKSNDQEPRSFQLSKGPSDLGSLFIPPILVFAGIWLFGSETFEYLIGFVSMAIVLVVVTMCIHLKLIPPRSKGSVATFCIFLAFDVFFVTYQIIKWGDKATVAGVILVILWGLIMPFFVALKCGLFRTK